jgi:predicted permease
MSADSHQDDFDEELEAHLRMATEELVWRGQPEHIARSSALREFGNLALIRDVSSQMRGAIWLERIVRDMRFAVRQIRKNPVFAVTLIGMLALGTTAPTLIATVSLQMLMRRMPYGNANGIFEIRTAAPSTELSGLSYSAIEQANDKAHVLSQIAYSTDDKRIFFVQTEGGVAQVSAPRISPGLFSLLNVHPTMGSGFGDLERNTTSGRFAILSHRLWHEGFRSKANIIGTTIAVNGTNYIVMGVMPPDFRFPVESGESQLWICACGKDQGSSPLSQRDRRFRVFARLEQHLRPAIASSLLNRNMTAPTALQASPSTSTIQVRLDTYRDSAVDSLTRKGLLALLLGAILLWLIACENATILLFARSSVRQKEFVIRRAVGGSQWRIARQLFIEALIISCLATSLAYGLSSAVIILSQHAFQAFLQIGVSPLPNVDTLLILLVLTFASAIICSSPASIKILRSAPQSLASSKHTHLPRRFQRYQRGLIVTIEIAMTFALLVACGLLLRTLNTLRHASSTLRSDNILVSDLKIPAYKFSHGDISSELLEPLVHRLQRMTGVEAVTLMTNVPLGDTYKISFRLERPANNRVHRKEELRANLRAVSPDMPHVFDTKILRGRFFQSTDTSAAPLVVVVNRAFASTYIARGRDPMDIVGQEIFDDGPHRRARVIGVLDDTPQNSFTQPAEPEISVCILQVTPDSRLYEAVYRLAVSVAVRTNASPSTMIPLLKNEIEAQEPQFGPVNFSSMSDVIEKSFFDRQIGAELISIFGVTALLLSAGGLYGLLAYAVSLRTKEIGVRIAFGASASKIAMLVAKEAAWVIGLGIGFGMCLVWLFSRYIDSFLFGTTSKDLATKSEAAIVILCCGALASLLPAYRASKIDAAKALRGI